MSDVFYLAKLLSTTPATNAFLEESFLQLQQAKPLYVYYQKSGQSNMVEVANEFIGDNYARLRGKSNLHFCD